MKERWQVTWPDGSVQFASSATDLLDLIRRQQFDPVADIAGMKRQLSDRAWILHHALVDESRDDDRFVRDLAACGFFARLDVSPDDADA